MCVKFKWICSNAGYSYTWNYEINLEYYAILQRYLYWLYYIFHTTTKRLLLWNKKNDMIVISLLFHSLQSQYNGRRNPHSRMSNQKRWSWAYKNYALQFINHISINETNCNTRCALQSCAKCFILLYFIRIKISLWALKRLK